MAEVKRTDLVVLGAGPSGYAAFLAADKGMKVTLINATVTAPCQDLLHRRSA